VRELVRAVVNLTASKAEVLYNTKTTAGVSRMCADLTLAAQKLNFKPSISLEEGLRLTLQRDPRFRG
jgi:UDP-glucose 4-epimerase